MSSDTTESTQAMTFAEFDIKTTTPKISRKLKDENDYPAWATEAKRHLWRMKLTDVVTGSQTEKPSTDEETWQGKTYKALDYLMDSVGDEA